MRLKNIFLSLFLFITFLLISKSNVLACCEGMCGSSDTCVFIETFQVSSWFPNCNGSCSNCQIIIACEAGSAGNYNPGSVYDAWSPAGYPTTSCQYDCSPTTEQSTTGSSGQVEETKTVYCGDCNPNPTPGGGGSGGSGDPTPTPDPSVTPGTVLISGSTNLDVDAAVSGSFCAQSTSSPLSIAGSDLYSTNIANSYSSTFTGNNFTINTSYSGSNYTVVLDLSGQTGGNNYVCSCPAAPDPNNPYICRYTGVGSPASNVNFYVKEFNLSNVSWFQVFGGNLFGRTSIDTDVPYTFCAADGNCQAALSVPKVGSTNKISSGFPISNAANPSNVKSSDSSTVQHSYFHLSDRTSNINSYGLSTDLGQLSYDYFYKLAENSMQQIGNGEDLEPLLSDWSNSAWWSSTDINYVRIDGNVSIDETQGFNLSSTQKLVVFVDGNLTLDDSNPNDANRKITSVADGGFLAFFVSGNILITPKVGYELNPSVPTVPSVTNANSNLEGVFVANGSLTVQSKTAIGEVPPDKKFIGAGTFVGWTAVNLNRTFDDGAFGPILNNNQAIENFFYRPDLLANWPTKLKASVSNWREVDPQLINQQ